MESGNVQRNFPKGQIRGMYVEGVNVRIPSRRQVRKFGRAPTTTNFYLSTRRSFYLKPRCYLYASPENLAT